MIDATQTQLFNHQHRTVIAPRNGWRMLDWRELAYRDLALQENFSASEPAWVESFA